jgi:hypothetical protein
VNGSSRSDAEVRGKVDRKYRAKSVMQHGRGVRYAKLMQTSAANVQT